MPPRTQLIPFRIGQLVRRHTRLSIADLIQQTKLSETAIRHQLSALMNAGLVSRDESGRKHLYALKPKCAYVVGVDVQRDQVVATVCDMRLNPCGAPSEVVDDEFSLTASADDGLERIARLITKAVKSASNCSPVIGVGVSMPAPIRTDTGKPASPYHLPGWEDVSVAKRLETLLPRAVRRPVVVDNDASVGSLACFLHGAYRDEDAPLDLLYIRPVEGIGAGIVLQGSLVGGGHGLAGEIGHFRVTKGGPLCPRCGGRGCLESIASTTAIEASLRTTDHWEQEQTLADMLADGEHPAVIYALGEAGDRIGIALSNACNLLNPDVIFLGGPLRGHAPYKEAIEAAISRYALKHSRPDVRWSPEMALTPELAGAAARAVQQFFDDHLQSTIEKTLPEDAVSP